MKKIMLGNEALGQGAWEAGVKVVSSYPGTPSTEVTEYLSGFGDEVYVEWAPNEKVATEVAMGACIGGARSLCCMKHVGLNVAADPLMTAAYQGVRGGFVLLVADDAGCHSSQNEQDSRYYARMAGVPMLEPSDAEECRDFMKAAFALSEDVDSLVIVRSNTRMSHSRGIVDTKEREELPLKPYEKDVSRFVMMPAMAVRSHVRQEKRMGELKQAANAIDFNRIELRDRKIGVITAGITYQYVREALPDASVLKLGMVWPLPEQLIRDFAEKVDKLYVMEELEPFIQTEIAAMGIKAQGKELLTIQGEYTPAMIKKAVLGVDTTYTEAPEKVPVRPPILCPGCPHRAVYYTLSKLGMFVTGDIGCYTLGTLAPLNSIDACLCMGASISMAHGLEKARGKDFARKLVAVIGDSTFFHSGITGLVDMYNNGATGTVMILDNSTTAMTGHQSNPATEKNAKGMPANPVDIPELVRGIGIKRVRVENPFDLKALSAAIKEETEAEELSVIIAKYPCIFIEPAAGKKLVVKDCRGCGACMKCGCPAIKRGADGKIEILPEQCNGCGLCADICPFGCITEA